MGKTVSCHPALGNLSFLHMPNPFPEQVVPCARAGAEPLPCCQGAAVATEHDANWCYFQRVHAESKEERKKKGTDSTENIR